MSRGSEFCCAGLEKPAFCRWTGFCRCAGFRGRVLVAVAELAMESLESIELEGPCLGPVYAAPGREPETPGGPAVREGGALGAGICLGGLATGAADGRFAASCIPI